MGRKVTTWVNGVIEDSLSGSVKTDLVNYPRTTPLQTLPAAGGKFFDPVFGTEIMRVTDANTDLGKRYGTTYSYWNAINADSTKIHAYSQNGGQGYLFDLNPLAFTLGAKTAINAPVAGATLEDAMWSYSDADSMFQSGGRQIYRYKPSTGLWTNYADLSSFFTPGTYFQQLSMSENDDVFAFTVRNADGSVRGFAAYRRSTNTLLKEVVFTTNQYPQYDEVQIDRSGRYLVFKTGNQSPLSAIEVVVYDLQATPQTQTDLTNGAPDLSPGHSDNGFGFVVGAEDTDSDSLTYRTLAAPHTFNKLLSFGFKSSGYHISMNLASGAWALVSTYGDSSIPALQNTGYLRDEILLVKVDSAAANNAAVRRLCHHESVYSLGYPDGVQSYYNTPRANISRDGKFVAFTSNWGVESGRHDLFVVKIPVEVYA